MFLKFGLKMCLIDLPLGFNFYNWALNHVKLWVLKCFPGIGPKGIEFDTFGVEFELEVQIWEFQFWTHARAGWLALEREIRAPSTLHCFEVRPSGIIDARAGHCVSCSSGCRAEISPMQYFYSPRERGSCRVSGYLCCMSARAGICFSEILKLFSECIFASSSHPRHS